MEPTCSRCNGGKRGREFVSVPGGMFQGNPVYYLLCPPCLEGSKEATDVDAYVADRPKVHQLNIGPARKHHGP